MAHSPMYHRLMMFVEAAKANEALAAHDNEHSAAMEAIDGSSESIQHFRQYQGFEGETGTAIDGWLEKADNRVAGWRASYLSASQIEVEMRRVMMHAREEAERLSPVLVDKGLDSLRDVAQVTIPVMRHYGISGKVVSAVVSTGAAVYDAIAAQANAQREANAADILQRLNASMQGLADQANQVVASQKQLEAQSEEWDPSALPHPSSPSTARQLANGHKWVSAHEGGVYPGDRDSDFGRSSLRGPNSGLYPGGFDDPDAEGARMRDAYKLQSRRIPHRLDAEGEPGTRTNPITDPQDLMGIDLMHTRIGGDRHANGTIGGYTPAPPTDRDHPLWRINGGPSTAALGGAGLLGAGALGVGAAARMHASPALAATTALRAGTYSGVGFGSYTPPTSLGTGVGGTTATPGTTGTSAAAGKNAAGRPGMSGIMGSGAGSGASKDEKKTPKRKYEPFRIDEEDELPPGYVNPMSQTYGSDKDITPAPTKDDGWDPRQW